MDNSNKTQQFQGDPKRYLGRYQLIRKIGEGGMGQVFQAYDVSLERTVALKLLLPGNTDETAIQRFIREAKSTAKLRHPHIVPIYDLEQYKNHYFIVMDFVDGWPLDKLIIHRKLTLNRVCLVTTSVLDALAYAHRSDIIHRDIKPQNILLDKQGTPFVTDFGLAKVIGSKTAKISQTGSILGTPAYMSPEQAKSDPAESVDARSDIYSMGAVFYEMLTGQPPFTGDSAFTILYKLASEAIVPPAQINPQIPEILERICLKALCKEKENRYAQAEDMADDLRSYLQQQTSDQKLTYAFTGDNTNRESIAPTRQLIAKTLRGKARVGQAKTMVRKAPAKTERQTTTNKLTMAILGIMAALLIVIVSGLLIRNFKEKRIQEANSRKIAAKKQLEKNTRQRWQEICATEDSLVKLQALKKFCVDPKYLASDFLAQRKRSIDIHHRSDIDIVIKECLDKIDQEARQIWQQIKQLPASDDKNTQIDNFCRKPRYQQSKWLTNNGEEILKVKFCNFLEIPELSPLERWRAMAQFMATSLQAKAIQKRQEIEQRILQQMIEHFLQDEVEKLQSCYKANLDILKQASAYEPQKIRLHQLLNNPQQVFQICNLRKRLHQLRQTLPEMPFEKFREATNEFDQLVLEFKRLSNDLLPEDHQSVSHLIREIGDHIINRELDHLVPQKPDKSKQTSSPKVDKPSSDLALAKAAQACERLLQLLKKGKIDQALTLCSSEYKREVLGIRQEAPGVVTCFQKTWLAVFGLFLSMSQQKIISKIHCWINDETKVRILVHCGDREFHFYFISRNNSWKYDGNLIEQAIRRRYLNECRPTPYHLRRLGKLLEEAIYSQHPTICLKPLMSSELTDKESGQSISRFIFLKQQLPTAGQWFVPKNSEFFPKELAVLIYSAKLKIVFCKEGPNFKVIAVR